MIVTLAMARARQANGEAREASLARGMASESRLVAILDAFERQEYGVRGSAIADADGLPIANGFREHLDLMSVAAMSALGLQSARRIFQHIGLEGLKAVVLEGADSKVVIYELGGGKASFIAVVDSDTKLGLLKLEMRAAAERIEQELGLAPAAETRVEEVQLLTKGGLLISHTSRTLIHPKDRDVLGAMLTVVQEFVRDSFSGKAGSLEEMGLANMVVRLVPGEVCTLAFVSTGPLSQSFLDRSRGALEAFEEANRVVLDPWKGDATTLKGLDNLLEELLHPRPVPVASAHMRRLEPLEEMVDPFEERRHC